MVNDAFDPGPDGSYPYFPREAAGRPAWSDSQSTDKIAVDGVAPMPRGWRQEGGRPVDVTPRNPDGPRSTRRRFPGRDPRSGDLEARPTGHAAKPRLWEGGPGGRWRTRRGDRCEGDQGAAPPLSPHTVREALVTAPARRGGRPWRRLRATILAGNPPCSICGLRLATTVDHIVPVSLGGAELDPYNCRPACTKCNYGRGARLVNSRRAARNVPEPSTRATGMVW